MPIPMFDDVSKAIALFIEESEKIQNNPKSKCNVSHCIGFLLERLEAKYGCEAISETRRLINKRIDLGSW